MIGLNSVSFNRLFPFHFIVDRDLNIVQMGASLLTIIPEANRFDNSFAVVKPELNSVFSFDSILECLKFNI